MPAATLYQAHTHQRQAICRAIAESEAPPSPEAIYEQVRKQVPSISLGTVYRNIKLFVDIGAPDLRGENHFPSNVYPADLAVLKAQMGPLRKYPVEVRDREIWAGLE